MALSRTWYTRAEVPIADFTTGTLQAKSFFWGFKALLMQQITTGTVGSGGAPPGSAAWTCDHSCDSVTAGTPGDGIDRWGSAFDDSKVVLGTGARSWFVLKSPARTGGVHFYIMVGLNGSTTGYWYLQFSKSAFTGGTTTTNPTNADSVAVASNIQATGDEALDYRLGYSTSADGSFHFMTNKVGAGLFNCYVGGWSLEEASTSDLHDFWMTQHWSPTGLGAPGSGLPTPKGRDPLNTGAGSSTWTYTSQFPSVPANWDTGVVPAMKVLLFSTGSPGGLRGFIPDSPQLGVTTPGKAIPSVAAQEQVTAGEWAIPWSVPVVL